ncbi:hypothetical protein KXJ69_11670 [Aureisphaera sp. CAU 1614]|uniref:Glycine dehydrogenase n=1 Tax=Halomarinibacterium sedimenti TaxID=2857106 RepID=A0A9X1FQK4_9FLAO|nr:hypothetical protein [Halomarinibacterium sedimenti]MAL58906.1 hypothetical protein [Flavobacteriaceae bacterium]MBW2938771.1 hypothetical protein [Halomarinibacterium sedimenti]HAT63535.1 hypothetical protein [Flavobacteriaceae bacterium]|tara:strand:- start:970 stop:1212 length:243 start_codon:yes stop_codon:yes gene_type:complete
MKFKNPCEKANHICDKSQYNEASFWEKVRLNLHLIYCKFCREYSANNQKLTKSIKDSKIKTLCNEDKGAIKEKLYQEMKK